MNDSMSGNLLELFQNFNESASVLFFWGGNPQFEQIHESFYDMQNIQQHITKGKAVLLNSFLYLTPTPIHTRATTNQN